jgi:hypothetical protein
MMDGIFDAALTSITAHRVKRLIRRKTSYRRCGLHRERRPDASVYAHPRWRAASSASRNTV